MQLMDLCIKCKGRGFCGKPCIILSRIKKYQPKVSLEFSGSSPPEIFVGQYNYPNVFTGIISPAEYGDTEYLSSPEMWHSNKNDIAEILSYRAKMIYSRFSSNIKQAISKNQNKLLDLMRKISLASKSADINFKLKNKPVQKINLDSHLPLMANPAFLKSAKLESNIKVEKKVDYLSNDTDVKATTAVNELYNSDISVSNIIKLLSAGMLGLKYQRKLVPTRWAITSVDDITSKMLLKKIRTYSQLSDILVFNADYLGNYYQILLLPKEWSFEVIESSENYFGYAKTAVWQDYEFFSERKKYASNVTGAYYSNRLAVCEYLESIKRQASCIVFREIRKEYWAPCGVGILREATREAMNKKPEKFDTLNNALKHISSKFNIPINVFIDKSKIIKNFKEQKRLSDFE